MGQAFGSGLRKFALDFVVVIFFKNAKKITSGGLIMSLEKFGLIWYSNFLQKSFVPKKNLRHVTIRDFKIKKSYFLNSNTY